MQNNILLNRRSEEGVLIAAHRGVSAGNIPFNTLPAFEAALLHGAHIIETDVTLSADNKVFVFHPGKEKAHLNKDIHLAQMTAEEIKKERYVNLDKDITECPISLLDEMLEQFKNRCLINIDHAWGYFPQTVECIRRHNMAEQIILKAPADEKYFRIIEEVAPDIMFLPIIKEKDEISEIIESMNINYAGAELVFAREDSPVASDEYISEQHRKGRALWVNAIVYYYRSILSGGHSDDIAAPGDYANGWGWLIDKGFDIIQTDWVMPLSMYIKNR